MTKTADDRRVSHRLLFAITPFVLFAVALFLLFA